MLLFPNSLICTIILALSYTDLFMSSTINLNSQKIVILGGGIHGVSAAYHMTLLGAKPLVIEQTSIGSAASGKAGGFLARGILSYTIFVYH